MDVQKLIDIFLKHDRCCLQHETCHHLSVAAEKQITLRPRSRNVYFDMNTTDSIVATVRGLETVINTTAECPERDVVAVTLRKR